MKTIKVVQDSIDFALSHEKLKSYLERSTLHIDRRLKSIRGSIISRKKEDKTRIFLIRIDVDIQLRDQNNALKEDAQVLIQYTNDGDTENFKLVKIRYVHEID